MSLSHRFRPRPINAALAFGLLCAGASPLLPARAQTLPAPADAAFDLARYYDKAEYQIAMRDGVKLFTSVYTPKDTSHPYPILLQRTPYSVGPYGKELKRSIGPSPAFAREGYIVVYQDVRGQNGSEGKWAEIRAHNPHKKTAQDIDESTDTFDTVDWLVKNVQNNNGRVGMWGISYPGFYVSSGIIDSHPAIKAASPQAPVTDWFHGDDDHHNGALWLPHSFNFYISFGQPRPKPGETPPPRFSHGTPDGYKFFLDMGSVANSEKYMQGRVEWWTEMLQHPNFDEFWKSRTITPFLTGIKPAVMTVGGWYDAEDLYGALHTYGAIERQNPQIPRNMLVMGPWSHGSWSRGDGDRLGDARWGAKTGEFYRENIELPFFNFYLKDKGQMTLPEAYVFETGANRWRTFAQWPPESAAKRSLYLHAGGKANFTASDTGAGFDEYVSDPAHPVPSTGRITVGMPGDYMTEDQRFASRRPDVLTYQTDALTEDLTVAGPVTPRLWAATSGQDSDYVVKLIDVYPDDTPTEADDRPGFQRGGMEFMVRGEPMRARFRNGFEKPEPMVPSRAAKVEWVMPDVCHTFRKGHRIMVQVQSSWFPMVDRNPQTWVPNINQAKDSDFKKATERIYHTSAMPSQVVLSVIPSEP